MICTHTHTFRNSADLFNVTIETEEIEDASAVHLCGMQPAHHGDRAGVVVDVGRALGQRVGHHLWDVVGGVVLVPAVARQRQQGAVWAWRNTRGQERSWGWSQQRSWGWSQQGSWG